MHDKLHVERHERAVPFLGQPILQTLQCCSGAAISSIKQSAASASMLYAIHTMHLDTRNTGHCHQVQQPSYKSARQTYLMSNNGTFPSSPLACMSKSRQH